MCLVNFTLTATEPSTRNTEMVREDGEGIAGAGVFGGPKGTVDPDNPKFLRFRYKVRD